MTLKEQRRISFTLDCVPPTVNHQSGRVVLLRPMFSKKRGRVVNVPRVADSRDLAQAKQMLEKLLLPHRVASPLQGPVTLTLEFTWPWRTSDTKRARAAGRQPKFTRPDCSNTAKTFEDRLVAMHFLEDDGQVVELIVRKYVGDHPGIQVTLAQFEFTDTEFQRRLDQHAHTHDGQQARAGGVQ